jgi:hypothetical protein
MGRKGWLVAALILVLGALLLLLSRGREEGVTPDAPRPAAPPPAGTAQPESPEAPEPEPTTPGSPGETAETPGESFEGRVRFAGTGRRPRTFSFTLTSQSGSYERVAVEGRDGSFRVVLPHPGNWSVAGIRTDGEDYPPTWIRVTARRGEPLEIVLQEAVAVTLLVMDARSHAPLADARAWRATHGGLGHTVDAPAPDGSVIRHAYPPAATLAGAPIAADRSGRIALGPDRGERTYYVLAPGYAWCAVEVIFAVEGQIPVWLRPGGAVEIRVLRWSELSGPALRMRPEGEKLDLRLPAPDENGELRLEGVVAGTHRFAVRRGANRGEGEEAGAATVEVVAGETVPVVIEAEPGAEKGVVVTGTLTVPAAWGPFAQAIQFQREVKPGVLVPGDYVVVKPPENGDSVEFRTKPLEPGRYHFEVQPFQWRGTAEVPASGTHLRIAVPDPVLVDVRVVDDGTGEGIEVAKVGWYLSVPGLTSYTIDSAQRHSTDRSRFLLLAPPGEVRLDVSAVGYQSRQVAVEISGPERVEETVRLSPAGTLLVRFTLEGEPYPSRDLRVTVAGDDGSRARRADADGAEFPGLAPGTYRVSVPDIAGLAPVPPREVEVRPGEPTEVTIALERRR